MVASRLHAVPLLLSALLVAACGERVDIEVRARLDGQPAAQAKVVLEREELGVTDAQGVLAKQITRKAGTELEVTVSKEAPGYRIEPWKTSFLVKLPKDGQPNKVLLEADLKAEYGARALYMEARACCRKEEDYVSMDLFEELLADEEGHINYLETQLNLLKDIGIENYGQLNAHSADELPKEDVGP